MNILTACLCVSILMGIAVLAYRAGRRSERRKREQDEIIWELVGKLPGRQAELMRWHRAGYSYSEIAQALNEPVDFVRDEIVKAYASLRMQLLSHERQPGWIRLWIMRQVAMRLA